MKIPKVLKTGLTSLKSAPHAADSIHFLHVRKAAGTQIAEVIAQVNATRSDGKLVKHGHDTTLKAIPADQAFFFSTRDPATRFKSGFYSRKRKGQPRYYFEWSEHEARAFARFEHANDLAEALFSEGEPGQAAAAAMRSIRHAAQNLVDWFGPFGHLFELRPPVWVIRQEHFEEDIAIFLKRIGYTAPIEIAANPQAAHANDYSAVPALSETAKANLARWYAQDYAFLELCEAWCRAQKDAMA